MSARPCVSRATSSPASKSSRWTRTWGGAATASPPGHRREQGDFPRPGDLLAVVGVFLVDRDTDGLRIAQRLGVAVAAPGQPVEKVAGRDHACRRLDLLLGKADPLAHPCEIFQLHRAAYSSMMCFSPARK